MLASPAIKNLMQTRTCVFTQAYKPKHILQSAVTAITLATLYSLLDWNTHQSWVSKPKHIGSFHHQNRGTSSIVRMNQGVHQRLTQSNMYQSIVFTLATL